MSPTSAQLRPMTLIAGPCVIEDEALTLEIAQELKSQLKAEIESGKIQLTFKASFDKANRTSVDGFRGPGIDGGLKTLERVRELTGLPILTVFHEAGQAERVAQVVDFMQIPAFLCRQTDLVVAGVQAAVKHGRRLNIKKGQFLAPWDTKNIVEKAAHAASGAGSARPLSEWLCLTERGVTHGYNSLVVDMISFQVMKRFGVETIYDATHSIQTPGAAPGGKSTGGKREFLETLARAAMAAGADGLFMECHPRPAQAKSDGPNAFYLDRVGTFVKQLLQIRALVATQPYLLDEAKK